MKEKAIKILTVIFAFAVAAVLSPQKILADECPREYTCIAPAGCSGNVHLFDCPSSPSYYVCCEQASSAGGSKDLGRLGGEGLGPWASLNLDSIAEPAKAFAKIISNAIGVMTIVAGIWFLFQFIIAAVSIIGASGEPEKMKSAMGKIQSALVGLVVTVAAYALISLIGAILGFEFLNIVSLIERLTP